MKFSTRNLIGIFLLLTFINPITTARAITLDDLRHIPKLTPEKFASYFENFEFQFHAEVQDHNVFLETKSGDCDDYATLAAEVLGRNGYTTRLIAVRMMGETHVVCYVNETKSYLDYNYRKEPVKLISCKKSITEIARHVAASFSRDWIATYQFTFNATEGVKRLVQSIITNRSTDKTS